MQTFPGFPASSTNEMEKLQLREPESIGVLAIAAQDAFPPADDLVKQAQSGDFSAYERLYQRHVARIHSLCLRMTTDRDRAEDLTQQAFIRAWEGLSSFRGDGGFAAWLKRVAINVVLADRRSRSRRPEQAIGDLETLEHPSVQLRPGSGLDLEQAIARLPERARAVFVLHDVEGYRHSDIAALLGIAAGTSKTQLHRARKLLREALRP